MSILIDMDMPDDCMACPCSDRDRMFCQVNNRSNRRIGYFENNRPIWCPLKEVTQVDIGEFLEGSVKTFNIPGKEG